MLAFRRQLYHQGTIASVKKHCMFPQSTVTLRVSRNYSKMAYLKLLKSHLLQPASPGFKGAASRPRSFCRAVARGSYLGKSCSKRHKIKDAVEALARIVYKPTKSASIKPIKLAKREVPPFHSIKLTCASESEVQTLKATVSQHEEDSNRELFPVPC